MDQIKPKISVIVPTVGRQTLEKSLKTIYDSEYPNLEVIISFNNCKIERVHEIQKQFKDATILYETKRLFPSQAKNRAINVATGDYITSLDDDDYAYPTKFWELSRFLKENPTYVAVFGQFDVVDVRTGEVKTRNCGGHKEVCFDTLIQNNYIASCSIMWRNQDDLRFDETKDFGEDYCLWLDMVAQYQVKHLEVPVYQWTQNIIDGYTATMSKNNIDWRKIVRENQQEKIKQWKK